jgi:hypothetical protein
MRPEGAAMLELPDCVVGYDRFAFNHLKLLYDLSRPFPDFDRLHSNSPIHSDADTIISREIWKVTAEGS